MKSKSTSKLCSVVLAAAFAAQSTLNVIADTSDELQASSLELDINLDLPMPNKPFHITLDPCESGLERHEYDLTSNSNGTTLSGTIENIPIGKYTMTVTSNGCAAYTQDVTITKGLTTKIELNNSKKKNTYITGSDKNAVMSAGDVNDDGNVDENDAEAVIEAIESGTNSEKYDLNNDNAVDIADLAYVTLNYGSNVEANELHIVSSENIHPSINASTSVVSGSLEDLTKNIDKFVRFSTSNNQEISENNPIELSLDITNTEDVTVNGIVIKPPTGSDNLIKSGDIEVEDEDGNFYSFYIGEESSPLKTYDETSPKKAETESDGSVVINIGAQIAVKKITIKVTGSSTKLVDIAKVEFLNNMEDRIPEPDYNIPQNIVLEQLSAGNDPSFKVTWDAQVNVSRYEVLVSSNGKQSVQTVNTNTLTVNNLGGKLSTYVPYTVRVRSVNGSWKSPYSTSAVITLTANSVPPAPEYVTAQGRAEAIDVSWRNMRDTQYYSIFYREKGTQEYAEIKNITATSYTIPNLKPNTTYELYVVGCNEYGASPASQLNEATTKAAENVVMPKYKLINTSNGTGVLTAHISNVEIPSAAVVTGDKNAVVDDDQSTYTTVNDWDTGVVYGNFANPIVTLDKKYTIDTIRFSPSAAQPYIYTGAKIRYINDSGAWAAAECSISEKKDTNGNRYYAVSAAQPITADTFQLCIRTFNSRMITISEIKFYYYDDLEDKINALYEDTMHLKLKSDVTQETINALYSQLEVPDSVSGELHPDYDSLKKELDYATELLSTGALADIVQVDTTITPNADTHNDFAMALSNYQPLGVVAQAGDEIIVYVGSENEAEGTKTNLNLIATQNHGEAANWQADIGQLSVGRNVITVPNIKTSADSENGGSLYVAWNGNSGAHKYSVRVSGGENIPVLNVAGITGAERTNAIKNYVSELEEYVQSVSQKHSENHSGKQYRSDCIDNYTEIVMNNIMYSVPADQVVKGLNGGGADTLEKAIAAIEEQVDLFYQHKGYNKNAGSSSKNRYPSQRLNIRYHTMFTGAFMYAGGKHIGIEYGSVPGLFSITPITSDEMGRKLGGNYAGWGISHEIGHVINSKSYAVAEVTNNYFSMLATQTERTDYNKVYKAVTKGSIGQNVDVFTQLAMYRQLHLFYDNYYDYKTFDDNDEQLKNLFFARVDSYARDTACAPKPGGVELSLNAGSSDNFIRLACAAAEKNLLPFFEAWGLSANDDTVKYASQFEQEDRKIQYINEDARKYRLEGGSTMGTSTAVKAEITTVHNDNIVKTNEIELSLSNNGGDAMLGYEIIRNNEPVAFVAADKTSFTDVITTGNNMVYEYSVVGYDKLLNKTEAVDIEAVKVMHDGEIGREKWSIETNMTSDDDTVIKADDDNGYCEDTIVSAVSNIIENGGRYSGKTDGDNAWLIIDLGAKEQITALKYGGEAAGFTVYVSDDKENWTEAKKGAFTGSGEETVYFNQNDRPGYMYIYNAGYVKVVFDTNAISVDDINILGPTSDNVELLSDGIGKLDKEFVYDNSNAIPSGSVVFTGTYKGNPAYNAVLLYDENGNIINGEQIILAEDPKDGELGDVSDGMWIYWIKPEDIPQVLPKRIRAELYRVDDPVNMTGERLVSNTLTIDVPDILPALNISGTAKTAENTPVTTLPSENENEETKALVDKNDGEAQDDAETAEEAAESQTNSDKEAENNSEIESLSNEIDKSILYDNNENYKSAAFKPLFNANTFKWSNALSSTEVVSGMTPKLDIDNFSTDNVTALSVSGQPVHAVTVSEDKIVKGFVFTGYENDESKALMQLNLDDETVKTIALQSSFKISDTKVTKVDINWSEVINNRAILKECRYDREKGSVNIYVVANEDLLDAGIITLGDVYMKAEDGISRANLTLNPNSTIALYDDYSKQSLSELSGGVSLKPVSDSNSGSDNNNNNSNGNNGNNDNNGNNNNDNNSNNNSNNNNNNNDNSSNNNNNNNTGGSNNESSSTSRSGSRSGKSSVLNESSKDNTTIDNNIKENGGDNIQQNTSNDVSVIFSDISKSAWYYNAVQKAYTNKWFVGTSEKEFSPNSSMTRGMFVTVLGRYANALTSENKRFDDVSSSAYYAGYVSWAADNGIVSGISDTKFAPDAYVTREQLAVMVYNYLNVNGISPNLNQEFEFADNSNISSWAKDAVYSMQSLGIISGMPDGTFNPKGTATRAEVATIMAKLDEQAAKNN